MMTTMLAPLAIATAMVFGTVVLHGFGLLALARLLGLERLEERAAHISPLSMRGLFATFIVVIGLFALHGIEIWAYAALYLALGALDDLHTAVYFSTITYATIGYDDEGLAAAWKLIAAIEGVNGIILLGWSTAFFVSLMRRLGRSR